MLRLSVTPEQISGDRHAAYTVVLLRSDPDHAPSVLGALRARLRQPADLRMTIGGGPVFYADIQAVSDPDPRPAPLGAFPFPLLALRLCFRRPAAPALPPPPRA